MAIALGIHVGAEEVSAVLVEADLPELGAISTRTVSVAAVPGGVGDAVTTMLGIMRVQAAQNDLRISGSGVVCDSIALCGIVRAALAAHEVRDVVVVDAGDPRLNAEVPLGVAAALIGTVDALTAWAGGPVDVPAESVDEVWNGSGSDAAGTPRGARLTMIGLGVAVLAALSGATVWALSAAGPTQNSVVDSADRTEMPSAGGSEVASSSVAVVAGSAVPPPAPSAVPSIEAGVFEAPVYGPVPVGTWSEALPASPVPTSMSSSGGGDSRAGSGGGRPGVVSGGGSEGRGDSDGDADGGASGGGNSGGGGDSGGEETTTVEPEPDPDPPTTTSPIETTTEVPVTTEPTTVDEEPAASPVE